jgi:hypothetical protein
MSAYLEINRTIFLRFAPNQFRDAVRQYLVPISARSRPIANNDPFIKFRLDPRNGKPDEDKTMKVRIR